MAEVVKDGAAAPAAEKPKITLLFFKDHTHHTGTFKKDDAGKPVKDAAGNEIEIIKVYRPGDRDTFTQADADTIRALRVAQTVANPGPPKA